MKHPLPRTLTKATFGALAAAAVLGAAWLVPAGAAVAAPPAHVSVAPTCEPGGCSGNG